MGRGAIRNSYTKLVVDVKLRFTDSRQADDFTYDFEIDIWKSLPRVAQLVRPPRPSDGARLTDHDITGGAFFSKHALLCELFTLFYNGACMFAS